MPDLLERAAALGFPTIRSAEEAGPGPHEPLLGGRAVSLGRRGTVVRVVVAEPPDRRLLSDLEVALGGPVLLEVGTPEVLRALLAGSASLLARLEGCSDFERLLLAPGQAAVGEVAGVRSELPFRVDATDGWDEGRVRAGGVGWCVRRRPTGVVEARRLAGRVPDLVDLSPPAALVEAVSAGSGRFCLVGGRSSGRSVLLASLLRRFLERPGAHVLAVGDPWEYPLRSPGRVVEQLDLPAGSDLPGWVFDVGADALLVDLRSAPVLPARTPPLTVVTSTSPLPGMVAVDLLRGDGPPTLRVAEQDLT